MNGGYIDWRGLFLSGDGRIPRTAWWLGVVLLMLVSGLYEGVAGPTVRLATFWFVYPALLWFAACVHWKRLHDRGRSGWWALLILAAFVAVWPITRPVAALLAAPVLVWTVVELGVMPGEQGANRFGRSPREPVQASSEAA
ncbi:MAG TPA: DUF805 domain-containing protein [Caulobacteraceae bacterium]|nr:DUF805 domain-containing protein [Caulobacteraceae bacterium]